MRFFFPPFGQQKFKLLIVIFFNIEKKFQVKLKKHLEKHKNK